MQNILIFALITLFISCNSQNKKTVAPKTKQTKEVAKNYVNSEEKKLVYKTGNDKKIVIKNKNDYSDKFVTELNEIGSEKFKLIDSLIIIDEVDSIFFPSTPKIGEKIILQGSKDDISITLTFKRKNYTSIDYSIGLTESGKSNHIYNGQADLSASFYFGAESNTSEVSGMSYFVTEFSNLKESNCYTYIRLGYEEETSPNLLGKIIKNCNDNIKDITLDNFITLKEYTD